MFSLGNNEGKNATLSSSSSTTTREGQSNSGEPKAKFYKILGREPPRTLSKFSNSLLSQLSRRPAPAIPDGSEPRPPSTYPSPPQEVRNEASSARAPPPNSSRRGSLSNHSDRVKEAALNSAKQKATVQKIVSDDKFFENFLAFCSKEFCGENPRFLKAVIEYRTVDNDTDKITGAQDIMGRFFLEDSAKHPVSLPAPKLNALMRRYEVREEQASGHLFDDAFSLIERELSLDVFPRYLNSKAYASLFERKKTNYQPLSATKSLDSSSMCSKIITNRLSPSRCKAVVKGWLEKRGAKFAFSGWKRRWIVLRPHFLFYFTPSQAMSDKAIAPQGQIAISEIIKVSKTRLADGTPCFAVMTKPRRYDFKASSHADRDNWVALLRKQVKDTHAKGHF